MYVLRKVQYLHLQGKYIPKEIDLIKHLSVCMYLEKYDIYIYKANTFLRPDIPKEIFSRAVTCSRKYPSTNLIVTK